MPAETDWGEWSREAARRMQIRNDALIERFQLAETHYRWNLELGRMGFLLQTEAVVAEICVVGSISDAAGTFLWEWDNDAVTPISIARLAPFREFGDTQDLRRLTTPEWAGAHSDGLEMLAVAGRILDAEAVWIERDGDRTFYFTLHQIRIEPLAGVPWLTA